MAPMVKRCGFPMVFPTVQGWSAHENEGIKNQDSHDMGRPARVREEKSCRAVCFFLWGSTMNVGCWSVVWNILYFPFHIWDVILPIDELIFFKMVTLW